MRNAVVGSVVAWALFGWFLLPFVSGRDLAPLLIAARLIHSGQGEHLYDLDAENFAATSPPWAREAARLGLTGEAAPYPYVYPPLWAALLAPVSGLGLPALRATVTILNLTALGLVVLLVAARWCPRFLQPLPLAAALVVAFVSRPVIHGILLGQLQPVVIALVVIAMAASQPGRKGQQGQKDRSGLAGGALALAAGLKLLPGVLAIYWAFTGRRRAALWFAAGVAVLAVASVAVAGWSPHVAYAQGLGRISRSLVFALNNQSLASWVGSWVRATPARMQPAPAWLRVLMAGVAVGAGAAVIAVGRRLARTRPEGTDAAMIADAADRADAAAMAAIVRIASPWPVPARLRFVLWAATQAAACC